MANLKAPKRRFKLVRKAKAGLSSVFVVMCLLLVRIYALFISPLTMARCRFLPTCSEYCREAIKLYGVRRGFVLTLKRLGKCHPWGSSGFDPVPVHKTRKFSHS